MTEDLDELLLEEQEPLTDEEILSCQPLNTDSANADIFEKRYATSARFVTQWDRWIAWDTNRWMIDGAEDKALAWAFYSARTSYTETWGRIEFFRNALKAMLAQRGGKCDETDKLQDRIEHLTKIAGWYLQSQNASRARSCLTASRPKLHTPMARLDANPWLFNVANGTIDLQTGDLKPHDRDDFITQLSPVEWDDSAKCPTWDRFIAETMQGDTELVMYLQRVVGYCMTALTTEHALFFLHGDGGNGKSTFTRIIHAMMGEYATAAPRGLLFEQRTGQAHPTELALLYGRRFVSCAEIGEQTAFDEAKVKDLTGGDVVAVRRMNEDFWNLVPTHKLLISGNHKPIVRGDDAGIWRRIRLIPWLFATKTPDHDLPRKLLGELPGILRWAVNGAAEWARIGLAEPSAVREATKDYRAESNIVGEFLKTCILHAEARCTAAELRTHYERWCKENGHVPLGGRMLGQRLRREGLEPKQMKVGRKVVHGWFGLSVPAVREPWEPEDD